MTQGFLYVATGQKYVDEAIHSAQSLKKHDKSASICLVTNKPFKNDIFDKVIVMERNNSKSWKTGLSFKVEGLLASPYEKTFFVDTDTYFTDRVSELFRVLDFFDLLICHASNDVSKIKIDGKKLEGLSPYNTGVIVYNNSEKIKSFFEQWMILYSSNPEKYFSDQPAFMEALLDHDIKIYVLTHIYNFRFTRFISVPPLKVKILHGRTTNFVKLNRIINKYPYNHRSWSPYWGMMFKNYRRFRGVKKVLIALFGRERINRFKKNVID